MNTSAIVAILLVLIIVMVGAAIAAARRGQRAEIRSFHDELSVRDKIDALR